MERKEKKLKLRESCLSVCVKLVSADKQLTKEEGNKEKCLFSSWNGQKDVTEEMILSVTVDSRVSTGSLVNHCSMI